MHDGVSVRPRVAVTSHQRRHRKTYIGMRDEDKVFIKRNTTPMLAALSREGITPKLVWTKRTGNGDTLTAQEWLEGRLLTPNEIGQRNDVIDVLYHLHHSNSLKTIDPYRWSCHDAGEDAAKI